MYKLVIASAIALVSLAASALPSNATTIIIGDNGGSNYHRHYDNRRGYDDRRDWDHHRHHRDCYMKRYTGWHHGHKVYRQEQVCR